MAMYLAMHVDLLAHQAETRATHEGMKEGLCSCAGNQVVNGTCLCSAVRPAPVEARPAGAMSAPVARPAGPATTAVDRKYQAFLAEMSELGAV